MKTFRDIISSTNFTTAISLGPSCMLFTTLPVTACWSQSTACGIEMRWGATLDWCQLYFLRKISFRRIDKCSFFIKKIFILNKIISKYKTIRISLTNVHLDCRGGGGRRVPVTGMLTSVATRYESVETGDESIEAGEKTRYSCYNAKNIVSHILFDMIPLWLANFTRFVSTEIARCIHYH